MPVVTKYICDGCGAEKGETNHWFRMGADRDAITFAEWSMGAYPRLFCGEKCVLAAISKWMQERKEAQ